MAKVTISYENDMERASIIDDLKIHHKILRITHECKSKNDNCKYRRVYVFLENKN